jgi:diguanylate cyclase (GGDEF)-like protein
MLAYNVGRCRVDEKLMGSTVQLGGALQLPQALLQEWQDVVDAVVRLGQAKVGLIMWHDQDWVEVLVASSGADNPYQVGHRETLPDSGLYCERVIECGQSLQVEDATRDPQWERNPDLALGMRAYLGYPICLRSGQVFGTICVLDSKSNPFSPELALVLEKIRGLLEHQLELLESRQQLQVQAERDGLTGLLNRRAFEIGARRELDRAQSLGTPLALVMFDLDFFKRINDQFGHLAGDELLIDTARKVGGMLRKSDLFGRYGGDEFIVLMPDTDLGLAARVCERIRAQLEGQYQAGGGSSVALSVSLGGASLALGDNLQRLLERADAALYQAKQSGRNRVCLQGEGEAP